MYFKKLTTLILLCLCSSLAWSQCNYPKKVTFPFAKYGNEYNVNFYKEYKLAKNWIEEMNSYLECIDKETTLSITILKINRGHTKEVEQRIVELQDKKYNTAFDNKRNFTVQLNKQVRIYKGIDENNSINAKMLQASSGTGFAVSYDGHIITNHHVIDACQKIKIRHKNEDIAAKLIAFDTVNDLAILKIDTKPSSVLPISYGNPEILQEIYAAGFPFGEKVSTTIKMTEGIVSSLTGFGNNYSHFQMTAALQPGNSGGPIFDDKGNVVGVAVAKIDKEYAIKNLGVIPENTNFGIKSSIVINFLESNSIGNLSSPLDYKASMTSLGKSVTDATYYVSCMMTMAQIRKVQARKVIYTELLK